MYWHKFKQRGKHWGVENWSTCCSVHSWLRLQYTCFRGGQCRYKESEQTKKPRNAPGSRLSGCTATLNAKLLKLECRELLHITFPLPLAYSGHSLKSLADLQSYKPLPEVIGRVESLVNNSYLCQVSLKLSLKEWVTKELIPQHIKQGILDDRPSEYDRHYYPTIQDLRNIPKVLLTKYEKTCSTRMPLKHYCRMKCNNILDSGILFESTNPQTKKTGKYYCACRFNNNNILNQLYTTNSV